MPAYKSVISGTVKQFYDPGQDRDENGKWVTTVGVGGGKTKGRVVSDRAHRVNQKIDAMTRPGGSQQGRIQTSRSGKTSFNPFEYSKGKRYNPSNKEHRSALARHLRNERYDKAHPPTGMVM